MKHFTLEDAPGVKHFRNAAPKVSHLPPTILTVTLIIPWTSHGNLRESEFDKIDSAIMDGDFPALERVRLIFIKHLAYGSNHDSMDGGSDIVYERFKPLKSYKKGLVCLEFR